MFPVRSGKSPAFLALLAQGRSSRAMSSPVIMQSSADFYFRSFSVSESLRAQMLTTLPAGQVVEQELRGILSSDSGTWLNPTEFELAPTPSFVSARTVLDYGDPGSKRTAAVVAGMKSPGELKILSEMAADLPPAMSAALLCNSTLQLSGPVPDGLDPDVLRRLGNVRIVNTLGLSLVDALLRGGTTYAEQLDAWKGDPAQFVQALERQLGWDLVGASNTELLARGLSDEILSMWRAMCAPELPRAMDGRRRSEPAMEQRRVFVRAQEPGVARAGFGFGLEYDRWVKYALWGMDSAQWREAIAQDPGKTCGRHIGERLFDVTGDDPGLWSVALELLGDWDRTLPEWLEAVAALT